MDEDFELEETLAERERLALLLEECGEVQQIIGKILRHGYGSFNPFDVKRTSNRKLLEKELGDLYAVVMLMVKAEDVSISTIRHHSELKGMKANQYLHFNEF